VVTVTDRDHPLLDAAGEGLLGSGWTGMPESVRGRFADLGSAGISEVLYTPAGPDIERELEAFAAATGAT
jgi:5,10-methylenetetrahydromethanopterin reductase